MQHIKFQDSLPSASGKMTVKAFIIYRQCGSTGHVTGTKYIIFVPKILASIDPVVSE